MFKSIRHQLSLLAYSWRAVGPGVMVKSSLSWQADREARNVDSGFDARFGTDTNHGMTPGEAGIPRERRGLATMYLPTMDADLEAMLAALAWPEELLRETTFIDLGSGKGRAVFLAGLRQFREVVGVELSPVLHAVAERNLAVMEGTGALASPVRLVLDDATRFDVPRGPVLVYLYHPFREPIAAAVVDRLLASLDESPRPAAILYCHPTLQRCLDPAVFAQRDVLQSVAAGERRTRRFRVGWTIWTNRSWLERRAAAVANDQR
jgi:SAM-dependent methyltransferase